MKLEYRTGKPSSDETDLLVLPVFQVKGKLDLRPWNDVDKNIGELLTRRAQSDHFEARFRQMLTADTPSLAASRVLLLGLGDKSRFTSERLRRATGAAASVAEAAHTGTMTIVLPSGTDVDAARLVRAAAEGVLLSSYRFNEYKAKRTQSRKADLKTLVILGSGRGAKVTAALTEAGVLAAATNLARDLINEPAGTLTPNEFAKRAKKLHGKGVTVKIHTKAMLEKMGARAILGVAAGSLEPPCMIELHYKPKKKSRKKLGVVGKGLTFDSGGLSLKPPGSMETMKCDMSGGAAVLGLFHAIRELQPKHEVVAVIGATENMPGVRATRPGDIVKAMNGKTIEILNTDAEGRLVLADLLHYMDKKHKPKMMVDLATLTGACVVALGDWTCAIYGNDDAARDSVLAAAKEADEKAWHMPLDEDLRSKLDSTVADLKNIGDRWGGSITAALFLREFVGDTPWVHMDIAGPAFAEKTPVVPGPKGGTGFGVRTLMEWVKKG